jgi:hypothetical protein
VRPCIKIFIGLALAACGPGINVAPDDCLPAAFRGAWESCIAGDGFISRFQVTLGCNDCRTDIEILQATGCDDPAPVALQRITTVDSASMVDLGPYKQFNTIRQEYWMTLVISEIAEARRGQCGMDPWPVGVPVDLYAIAGLTLPNPNCFDDGPIDPKGFSGSSRIELTGGQICSSTTSFTDVSAPPPLDICFTPAN